MGLEVRVMRGMLGAVLVVAAIGLGGCDTSADLCERWCATTGCYTGGEGCVDACESSRRSVEGGPCEDEHTALLECDAASHAAMCTDGCNDELAAVAACTGSGS